MSSKRRKAEHERRMAIARGLRIRCLSCGVSDQVPPGRYHSGKARCAYCGGSVERVHAPGAEHGPKVKSVIPKRAAKQISARSWKKRRRPRPAARPSADIRAMEAHLAAITRQLAPLC